MYHIYFLLHPITGDPGYVGCSRTPYLRYSRHLEVSDGTPKDDWIAGLPQLPELFVFTEVHEKKVAFSLETTLIHILRASGLPLYNVYEGQGPSRGSRTDVVRQQVSESLRRTHAAKTTEQKAERAGRISVAQRGTIYSPERIASMRAGRWGKRKSEA